MTHAMLIMHYAHIHTHVGEHRCIGLMCAARLALLHAL